jgi:hypothetical protein
MALPVITDVYRVALHWQSNVAGTAANIFHVKGPHAGYPNSPAVFTCIDAHVTSALWTFVSSNLTLDQVAITPLDGSTATHIETVTPSAKYSGQSAGEAIPNMANIIKLQTNKRGKSYRGRLYLPNVGEPDQTNGKLATAKVPTTTTAWNTFMTAIGTDATTPLTLGVASYKLSTFEAALSCLCEPTAATQRRRLSRLRG